MTNQEELIIAFSKFVYAGEKCISISNKMSDIEKEEARKQFETDSQYIDLKNRIEIMRGESNEESNNFINELF